MSGNSLQVGFGDVEITPPVGLFMCGGLQPRTNTGVGDPLRAKTLVAANGSGQIAIVGVDLIGLPRAYVDAAIEQASARTGIPKDAIIVSCSHTHSGPYTEDGLYSYGVTNPPYLDTLPGLLAESICQAHAALRPVTMHIGRSLVHHGLHHRRVLNKRENKAFNTWMSDALNDLEVCPQILGSCGPIDPEMWVVRFDDLSGTPYGALVNFSVHVNSRFGVTYSADYPGVMAETMRTTYGPQMQMVFTPGACANVNPTMGGDRWLDGAQFFAGEAIAAAKRAKKVEGDIPVAGARLDLTVDRRDPATQPPEAVHRLNWGGGNAYPDVFDPVAAKLAESPKTRMVPVTAVRIGPFAMASNPGELFVEHGLTIKRRSPFPHTVVAELSNDIILYQPTREAFEQQGYETLAGANRVSPDGIEAIVDGASDLLERLWGAGES
ncbi:MAG: hypothetical protein ACYC5M_00845 [Anaerolineae bacterium]